MYVEAPSPIVTKNRTSKEVIKVKGDHKGGSVTQLCMPLWDPANYSPQGSSVHGILQAGTLEWVLPFSSSGDPSNSGIKPGSPALKAEALPSEPQEKPR